MSLEIWPFLFPPSPFSLPPHHFSFFHFFPFPPIAFPPFFQSTIPFPLHAPLSLLIPLPSSAFSLFPRSSSLLHPLFPLFSFPSFSLFFFLSFSFFFFSGFQFQIFPFLFFISRLDRAEEVDPCCSLDRWAGAWGLLMNPPSGWLGASPIVTFQFRGPRSRGCLPATGG